VRLLEKLRKRKEGKQETPVRERWSIFCKDIQRGIIYLPALLFACTRAAIHKLVGLFQRESDLCELSAFKHLESLAPHSNL